MNTPPIPFSTLFWEELKKIDENGILVDKDLQNLKEIAIQEESYIRGKLSFVKDKNPADEIICAAFSVHINKISDDKNYFDYKINPYVDLSKQSPDKLKNILATWKNSIDCFTNPLIISRLSDLIWDFGISTKQKFKNHHQFAEIAVKNYLKIIDEGLVISDPLLDCYLSRALELSSKHSLEQNQNLKRIACEKLTFEKGKIYLYIETFKMLKKQNLLTEQIENEISELLVFKCNKREDFYGAGYNQKITEILVCFISCCKNDKCKKEISNKCGEGFIKFRSRNEGLYIPAFLKIANNLLSREVHSKLSKIIENFNQHNEGNMVYNKVSLTKMDEKEISQVFIKKLPESSIETFIEGFLVFTNGNIKHYTSLVQKSAPIASLALFNSYEEHRLVYSASDHGEAFSLNLIKIVFDHSLLEVFDKIIYHHTLNEDFFINMVQNCDFVPPAKKCYISEAIRYLFQGNFIASLHVFVPQIEGLLRHIAHVFCEVPHQLNDGKNGHSINMLRYILDNENMRAYLGEELATHLKLLFLNEQGLGFDFRNKVAHGLLEVGEANKVNTLWVMHALLAVCSMVSEKMKLQKEEVVSA